LHLQAKLLRVLQERQLTRLGSEQAIALDVRVIAATNKDLRESMSAREFREDLYFRISTFKLRVPALKNRPGDILPLVASLLVRHSHNSDEFTLSEEAQAKLLTYAWPGNVRELENVVQRAVVLCSNNHIELSHLMFDDASEMLLSEDSSTLEPSESFQAQKTLTPMAVEVNNAKTTLAPNSFSASQTAPMAQVTLASNLQEAVKSNEHQLILTAIQSTDSRIEAARALGISPRTLRYKMARLKLETSNMAMAG